jgi:hypothetical protein
MDAKHAISLLYIAMPLHNETFAKMLLDRTEGVLPTSKSEFRRVASQNAALAAQNAGPLFRDRGFGSPGSGIVKKR